MVWHSQWLFHWSLFFEKNVDRDSYLELLRDRLPELLSPYQTRDWDWDWIGFWPIKSKFTKLEIGFLSSDWLNSNPISISFSSLIRALKDVDLATRQRMWLQQDDAVSHFARIVRDFLNNNYNDQVDWTRRSS